MLVSAAALRSYMSMSGPADLPTGDRAEVVSLVCAESGVRTAASARLWFREADGWQADFVAHRAAPLWCL